MLSLPRRMKINMRKAHFWRIATHAACRSSLSPGVCCHRNGYLASHSNRPNDIYRGEIENENDTSACGCDLINGVRCPNANAHEHSAHSSQPSETNGAHSGHDNHIDGVLWICDSLICRNKNSFVCIYGVSAHFVAPIASPIATTSLNTQFFLLTVFSLEV